MSLQDQDIQLFEKVVQSQQFISTGSDLSNNPPDYSHANIFNQKEDDDDRDNIEMVQQYDLGPSIPSLSSEFNPLITSEQVYEDGLGLEHYPYLEFNLSEDNKPFYEKRQQKKQKSDSSSSSSQEQFEGNVGQEYKKYSEYILRPTKLIKKEMKNTNLPKHLIKMFKQVCDEHGFSALSSPCRKKLMKISAMKTSPDRSTLQYLFGSNPQDQQTQKFNRDILRKYLRKRLNNMYLFEKSYVKRIKIYMIGIKVFACRLSNAQLATRLQSK